MRQPPIPRQPIFDLYWRFAYERQSIFERRLAGEAQPWTTDPILQEFKFCNVYRALDRVSQYLIRDVAYGGSGCTDDDRLFQIVAFRLFSRIETWQALIDFFGRPPVLQDLVKGRFELALDTVRARNGKLYTSAFILCAADAFGKGMKHLNHAALLRRMFHEDDLAPKLRNAGSLAEVFDMLRDYPLFGDFMSYQVAIDLNYSDQLDFSENEFTKPGPGALRGLRKVFATWSDYSASETILWMVDRQEAEFQRLGLEFGGLRGRPLHAIDIQGLFCEVDKYCRVAFPDLLSQRKRIKTKFRPKANLPTYFLPPKWGVAESAFEVSLAHQERLPFANAASS